MLAPPVAVALVHPLATVDVIPHQAGRATRVVGVVTEPESRCGRLGGRPAGVVG